MYGNTIVRQHMDNSVVMVLRSSIPQTLSSVIDGHSSVLAFEFLAASLQLRGEGDALRGTAFEWLLGFLATRGPRVRNLGGTRLLRYRGERMLSCRGTFGSCQGVTSWDDAAGEHCASMVVSSRHSWPWGLSLCPWESSPNLACKHSLLMVRSN